MLDASQPRLAQVRDMSPQVAVIDEDARTIWYIPARSIPDLPMPEMYKAHVKAVERYDRR